MEIGSFLFWALELPGGLLPLKRRHPGLCRQTQGSTSHDCARLGRAQSNQLQIVEQQQLLQLFQVRVA